MSALAAPVCDLPSPEPDRVRGAVGDLTYSTTPRVCVRLLREAGVTLAGCAVYHAIADRQMPGGGEYLRSNAALADEAGVSLRTAQKWVIRLEEMGLVERWEQAGRRRLRVTTAQPAAPEARLVAHLGAASGAIGALGCAHKKKTLRRKHEEEDNSTPAKPAGGCVFSTAVAEGCRALPGDQG